MKKNIYINLELDGGKFTDMKMTTSDGRYVKCEVAGLSCPATLTQVIEILTEQLTVLTDIKCNIGDKVLVDGEFICTIVDICSDSGRVYYEVKCDAFNGFNRHVKIDQIKEVK